MIKKRLLALMVALLLSTTGCAGQAASTMTVDSVFCTGTCLADISVNHACVWQYLALQIAYQR